MRFFFSCALVMSLSHHAFAAEAEQAVTQQTNATVVSAKQDADENKGPRRCAYLGRCGSFHILGNGGSAAYMLGRGQYIADLSFAGEDKNFWYFSPTGGDQFTSKWAFSKHRNCGRYWVWRQDRGGWKQYEATRAWGNDLDEKSSGEGVKTAATNVEVLKATVDDHEQRLRDLEQKMK